MSIKIDMNKCIGCLKCKSVCPGNLICVSDEGRAYIRYEEDCWGCTACLKECAEGAIEYYLGADIGGMGSKMHISMNGNELDWHIKHRRGDEYVISTSRCKSNKY